MKSLVLAVIMSGIYMGLSGMAQAGSCDHSWQTAKDGSSCGERAADRREGGN